MRAWAPFRCGFFVPTKDIPFVVSSETSWGLVKKIVTILGDQHCRSIQWLHMYYLDYHFSISFLASLFWKASPLC